MADYQLAGFLVKDLQPLLFRFLHLYRTALSHVSSTGNRVEVAIVTDGIALRTKYSFIFQWDSVDIPW